jgi:hypothetical protein
MDTALSRHSGAGRNSSQQSEGLDSGLRRGDEMNKDILPLPQGEGRGEGSSSIKNLPALLDETIQSNQRLADSIKRRIDVGDLPRFT